MANDLAIFRGASGVGRARETIDRMDAHGVPPTPANYEIWATYLAGAHPELCREITARLARAEPFTDEVNQELHERFFANTRLSMQMLETSETIARELGDVVTGLDEARDQSNAYASELTQAADGIAAGLSGDQLAALARKLGDTTREAALHNQQLAEQMELSARQIAELRAALESVKVEALTDGLTGLANRRMFDEALSKRLSETDNSELCVVLIDIDQFKHLNETWGESIGDQVMRYVASVLRALTNGDVLTARYGADEFALIMPRTGVNLAEGVAARIARTVKSKQLSRKSTGDQIGCISLCIGVAQSGPAESASALISRVEACLCAAKRMGREQIVTDLQLRRSSAA